MCYYIYYIEYNFILGVNQYENSFVINSYSVNLPGSNHCPATTISDNFNGTTQLEWIDVYGSWDVVNDRFQPQTFESVPNSQAAVSAYNDNTLDDVIVEYDIYNVDTTALFLRSSLMHQDSFGLDTVVALMMGHAHTNQMFWFIYLNGTHLASTSISTPNILNNDVHVKVVAQGDTFSAYYYIYGEDNTGWDTVPFSTFTTTDYGVSIDAGYVALFNDLRATSTPMVDNFSLTTQTIPEPMSLILLLSGICMYLPKIKRM